MTKAYLLGFICAATRGNADQCPYDDSRWYLVEFEHWHLGFSDGASPHTDSLLNVTKICAQ